MSFELLAIVLVYSCLSVCTSIYIYRFREDGPDALDIAFAIVWPIFWVGYLREYLIEKVDGRRE